MKVLLYQLDGKVPNIALMRIAHHHRSQGDEVTLRKVPRSVETQLWDNFDVVYASLIFERTRPLAERLRRIHSASIIGGTGWDQGITLEDVGITTKQQDYSDWPDWRQSIGFTQRGCRLKCPFCVVPEKEGAVSEEQTIGELWRGDPWPKELILLDNDFFGQPDWRKRIEEIQAGGFKVNFSQGINARMITDEAAAAIASVDYQNTRMDAKRIYTAWDNRKDEKKLFKGLELLVKHGVRPHNIMVYMLVGYWPGETEEDRLYRQGRLRDFGAVPYPMPYVRTKELIGFQRWVVGAYDKRIFWDDWKLAGYRPEHLGEGLVNHVNSTAMGKTATAEKD